MFRKLLAFLFLLMLLGSAAAEDAPFVLFNGDRESRKIAITVDDCYSAGRLRQIFDIAQENQVPVTFYPLGTVIKKKDAALWQEIAASDCEIGTHTYAHAPMGNLSTRLVVASIGRSQEALDRVLGYHYRIRSVRPPYGNYKDKSGRSGAVIKGLAMFDIHHVVNWDISQTKAEKALPLVKGGSILLFHTIPLDVQCLEVLIPQLKEAGWELVTVSELLDLGEKETSPEPFVYRAKDFFP